MNIANFPTSRMLRDIPKASLSKVLATAYAFYAFVHQRNEHLNDKQKVAGSILGGFPVWYVCRKPVENARLGSTFVRSIKGGNHWFYRSNSEFVAIQFHVLDGPDLTGDSAVFSHVEYDDAERPKLSSTFIVSMELFTRIGLFLHNLGDQSAYPRIIVIPETSQCGLLVTTNHRASRHLREHLIFPLPELSFGRANRQGDDFRNSTMSLEKFVLSSEYPMKIEFASNADLD